MNFDMLSALNHLLHQLFQQRSPQATPRRNPRILMLVILGWSLAMGWGLAAIHHPSAIASANITSTHLETSASQSAEISQSVPDSDSTPPTESVQFPQISDIGTVDPVPSGYQLGQQLYVETCGSCHLALPPAILPSETWRQILLSTEHYSVELPPLVDPPRLLIWNYLRDFSRNVAEDETVPYRITNSRYFRALHPQVPLAEPVRSDSCQTCHPGASQYNFRTLSPDWLDG